MVRTTRAKAVAECHWVEAETTMPDTLEVIEAVNELGAFTVIRALCGLVWLVAWASTALGHWRATEGARIDMVGAMGVLAVAGGLVWLMR